MSDGEVFSASAVGAATLRAVADYISHTGMSGWTGGAIINKLRLDAQKKSVTERRKRAIVEIGRLIINTIDDPNGPAENEYEQAERIGLAALRVIQEQASDLVGWTIAPPVEDPFGYDDLTDAYSTSGGYTISDIEAMRTKLGGDA